MELCPGQVSHATRTALTERPTLLDVFREHGSAYAAGHTLRPEQRRFLHDVQVCRTATLGGHLYVCDHCGHELPVYNSCKNRHCPACQALDQHRWITKRKERILPVGHHHVVFTLPSELRPLARLRSRELYGVLFEAAGAALVHLARERWNARIGVTCVLHTWTRELRFHPHIHAIVTAGGLRLDDQAWTDQSHYLFPANLLKRLFESRLRERLQALRDHGLLLPGESTPDPRAWASFLDRLPPWRRWVVHIEPPFGRSTHVLEYLGRYTHRVAISDTRLVRIDDGTVTIRTRGDDQVTLDAHEFIRRFLLHILPKGFHKIRHLGLYASAAGRRLSLARDAIGEGDRNDEQDRDDLEWPELLEVLTGEDPLRCPHCKTGRFRREAQLPPRRAPP